MLFWYNLNSFELITGTEVPKFFSDLNFILLSKFMYLDCYIEQIKEIINKYNEKEQLVLNDVLNRCIVYVDESVKVKTI